MVFGASGGVVSTPGTGDILDLNGHAITSTGSDGAYLGSDGTIFTIVDSAAVKGSFAFGGTNNGLIRCGLGARCLFSASHNPGVVMALSAALWNLTPPPIMRGS